MVKAQIEYPFPDLPEGGQAIQVAEGVHWIRMPLPFALNHINLWLLEDDDGWTLVDCGIARPEVKELWEQIFENVLAGRPVKRLIVTHYHPDHIGLAGWLCARFDIRMWMTLSEWAMGRLLKTAEEHEAIALQEDFYFKAGFTPDLMALVPERVNSYAERIELPPASYIRMLDGDEIMINGKPWEVIVGRGHSPEHACLYCEDLDVMIAGDQVLPKISPNISVWPNEPLSNPLELFLESLPDFEELPGDTLILPSHDRPFYGLHGRLHELAHHHDERLEETLRICEDPVTAYQVLQSLFTRKLDSHQIFFAIGESLAHLHYLEGVGKVRRLESEGEPVLFVAG